MPNYRPWNDEDREKLAELLEQDLEISEIAEQLDRTEQSIEYEINRSNYITIEPAKKSKERRTLLEGAAVTFLDQNKSEGNYKDIWNTIINFQKELEKINTEQSQATIQINTDKWIGIAFQGDLHLGNMTTDYTQLLSDKKLIQDNDNVFVAINGDYCDNYISGSPGSGGFEALFPPAIQKDLAKDYIKSIKDKVLALVAGCFMSGSKVTMGDGTEKNIEDIEVGDGVMSEDGIPQRITKRYSNYHNGKVLKIHSEGNNEPLHVTWDHPCLVLKRNDVLSSNGQYIKKYSFVKDNLKKIRAHKIEVNDYICSPIPRSKKGSPSTKFKNYKYDIDIPFLRLAGYWLAEGNYRKYKDTKKSLMLTFGKTEKNYIKETLDITKNLGIDYSFRIRKDRNTCDIEIKDENLASMFFELFGEYSDKKFIHPEILAQPPIKLTHLVNTFANGDGCTREQHNRTDVTLTTVSRDLANGLSFALTKSGIFHSLRQQDRSKQKGKKNDYQINFGEESLDCLKHILELHEEDRSKSANASRTQKCGKKGAGQKVYDGYTWHRVTKIEEEEFAGFVYNVAVDKTSQLVVNKRLIHNCHDIFSLKVDDFDLTEYLAKHGQAVYLGSGGDLFLQLPGHTYKIKMRHKYRFNSSDNATATVKKMFEKEGGFDCGVISHNHIAAMEESLKAGLDGNLKRIFLRAGSYKTSDRYSKQMGFSGGVSGVPIVLFNPHKRDMRGFEDLENGIKYLNYLNKEEK